MIITENYLMNYIKITNKLDIFESGRSIEKVIIELKRKMRDNYPHKNLTDIKPRFVYEETDKWIVFPHELEDLSKEQIEQNDKEVADIIFLE